MTIVPASYGSRVGAYLIDVGLVILLYIPSWIAQGVAAGRLGNGDFDAYESAEQAATVLTWIAVVLALIYWLIQGIAQGSSGMTIGKRAVGLRTVRADTLQAAGFWRIVLRYLIISLGAFVVYVGALVVLLSPLWDPNKRNRGWHDYAANTWVIDVKRGPNPLVAAPVVAVVEPTVVPTGITSVTLSGPSVVEPSRSESITATAPSGPETGVPLTAAQPPASAPVVSAPAASAPASQIPVSPFPAPQAGVISEIPGFVPAPVEPTPTTPAPALSVQPLAAVPQHSAAVEDDDELDATRIAGVPAGAVAAILRFDSGEDFDVTGTTVIGRNPTAVDGVGVIAVSDTTRSLSKAHAEVGIDGTRFWVQDRRSTNGTRVRRLDGTEEVVDSGRRVFVAPGETVLLGERSFTFRWRQ